MQVLNLSACPFYRCRTVTNATVMLLQGVHPKVVQERLGHAKMSTAMDLYSHVMPSMQKDAVDQFEMA